ncbi:hypothetical protein K8B33_13885 [Alcanivorax sp. JB21]|uniref:hypothetical protein n=1 Tax=Alcanivorax limicola TaxID=2874102 RepID=UPI001CBB929C|nr:hypothetical protein [Alcanivorax limicola]MBZ2190195.1 hypothetical protein [Alcanivorax limicola]
MIWHLIAAIFAALGAAGIALLLRLASGKRLPRWIIPVFAGLGMLGYQIHFEYTWFEHKRQQLPVTAEVISAEERSMLWRPWTQFFPMTVAFNVIDHEHLVTRQVNSQTLVEFVLYRFEREYVEQVSAQPYLMNCHTAELVPLASENRPHTEALRTMARTSPLYRAVCAG